MMKTTNIKLISSRRCWHHAMLFALLFALKCSAFHVPTAGLKTAGHHHRHRTATVMKECPSASPSALSSSLFSSVAIKSAVPVVQKAVLALVAALCWVFRNRILWPGATPDKSLSEPLPPGSYGCPFIGFNPMEGSHSYGPGVLFTRAFKKLGRPKLFKFYGFGRPFVSVTGKEAIQSITKNEFQDVSTIDMAAFPNSVDLFGNRSILYEHDKDKHSMLRRLVGVSMRPQALEQALPAIEKAALEQVGAMSASDTAVMEKICHDFTVDVAWRQILGLELAGKEEIDEFHKSVRDWMEGMMSVMLFVPFRIPGLHRTKTFKAKEYLVQQVEKKLKQLERNGPDGSTLSSIYFATMDGERLTHEEIIHNALILILAGSETSSSTLTNAMLFLGLHKNVLHKLQQEQDQLVAKHGPELTKNLLEEDCPYLDAFIRETLRIRPIPSLEMRETTKSIVMDGQQIPKSFSIWANIRATHDQDPACRVNDTDDHMDVVKGFSPERWLSAESKPQEWMPFGDGPRRCLGERLAMLEMKVFLATMLRKVKDFDLVTEYDDIKWKKFTVIPRPLDGVIVRPAFV
jgi:cytochrome P450